MDLSPPAENVKTWIWGCINRRFQNDGIAKICFFGNANILEVPIIPTPSLVMTSLKSGRLEKMITDQAMRLNVFPRCDCLLDAIPREVKKRFFTVLCPPNVPERWRLLTFFCHILEE